MTSRVIPLLFFVTIDQTACCYDLKHQLGELLSLAVMVACVIFAGHYLHQGKGEVNLFYFAIFLFCLSIYSFYKHAQHMKKRQLSIQGYGHASRWLALRRHH